MVYWDMVDWLMVEGGVVESRQGVMMGQVRSCWQMMVAGKSMAGGWRKVWGVANDWQRWFLEMGSWEMGGGVNRGNREGCKVKEGLLREWGAECSSHEEHLEIYFILSILK